MKERQDWSREVLREDRGKENSCMQEENNVSMKQGREGRTAWPVSMEQRKTRIWANNCPKEISGRGDTKELNFPLQAHVLSNSPGCLSQTFGFRQFPEIHRKMIFVCHLPPHHHTQLLTQVRIHTGVHLLCLWPVGLCCSHSGSAQASDRAVMGCAAQRCPGAAGAHMVLETHSPPHQSRVQASETGWGVFKSFPSLLLQLFGQ